MANNTSLSIEIFGPNLEPIDLLERVTGLRWTERFTSYGDFELWAPITEKNAELLKEENYVWINESDTAGIIEYVEKSRNDKGEKEFHVKGRHLIALLRGRVVYPTFKASGQISSVMKKQIEQYAISPQNENNKIEQLSIYNDADFGDNVSYQQTGSDLMEEQLYLCEANNVGIRIDLDYNNKKMLYKVLRPTDRSWSQSNVDPVMFDSSSDEILSSNYTANKSEVCNVAIVAGEGEGSDRKVIEVQEGFYPITNLITNGSFESDISGWEVNGQGTLSQSADVAYIGSHSLKCVAPNAKAYSGPKINVTSLLNMSHKYYLLCHGMCTVLGSSGFWYGEIGRIESGSNKYVGIYDGGSQTALNQWLRGCAYIDFLNNNVTSVWIAPIRFGNTGAAGDTMYQDGICLVDLTDAFGAGNEPDKTWCDTHLSYFEGTVYISKNSYVAYNQIIGGDFEDKTHWQVQSSLAATAGFNSTAGVNGSWCFASLSTIYANAPYSLLIYNRVVGAKKNNILYFYCMAKGHTIPNPGEAQYYFHLGEIVNGTQNWSNIHLWNVNTTEFERYSFTLTTNLDATYNNFSVITLNGADTSNQWLIVDNFAFINLTETFGAGNEPTKEWCDANIPFFEGTRVLSQSITKGLKRKELWVDARDLQSTDENDMQLSDAEYNKLLWQRGLQKLSDYKIVENFSSIIKTFGFQQYEYNKDYFLGDTVTVADREIDITMDTQITEVERVWDENGYSFSLTFGKTQPTILDVAKRK